MSDTVCERCGAFGDLPHEKLPGDCALPHKKHSRRLIDGGRICQHCAEQWHEWLTELPDLHATLHQVLYVGSIPDDTAEHAHQKATGSPSPIRLNAWALLRNEVEDHIIDVTYTPAGRHEAVRSAYLDGHLPDIAAVLSGWEQAVRDDIGWISTASGTTTGAVAFLTAHINELAALPDAEDFHTELRWVRTALRTAHGISDPQPLFDCLTIDCGGHVWPMPAGSPRCDRCNRAYGTLDYVRAKGDGLHERPRRIRAASAGAGGRP